VPTVVDPIMEELVTTVYEYTITPEAQLTDEDGSEVLNDIIIDGIPGEAEIIDNYTFESDEQLSSDVLDGITASVTSTEDSNGDEATITVNQNGIVSIEAGSGSDSLIGGDGEQSIDGGAGDDTLIGGDDNDYINGGIGNDTIDGGAGDDTIVYDIADTEIDGGLDSDTLIATSGVVDLSNVSNIEVIQLSSGATVIGSDTLLGINATDVISATDIDNTLMIQSIDDNSYEISVNTDSLVLQDTSIEIDGIDYAQYIGGGATLLIEIDDSIEVV
jgi:Ca2+-binding RTX toxin-like protein